LNRKPWNLQYIDGRIQKIGTIQGDKMENVTNLELQKQKESRDARSSALLSQKEAVNAIQEEFMEVVKRICMEHSAELLTTREATLKVGFAKVKCKKKINNLVEEFIHPPSNSIAYYI